MTPTQPNPPAPEKPKPAPPEKPAKKQAEPSHPLTPDELVDEASEESFPASDPPSYNPTRTGSPRKH